MLRKTKAMMVLSVALWGLLGAAHNFMDWQGTLGAVTAATSMVTLPEGGDYWQATSNTLLVWLGALFIVSGKLSAMGFCGIGGMRMLRSAGSDAHAFKAAKEMALVGCGIAMFMLFTGFIVIAESWFELWRSEVMRDPVLQSAFRYGAMITLIALFVAGDE